MVQILYTITKENEIILAQNCQFNTREEAKTALKETYNDIMTKNNIKNVYYNNQRKLIFTDTKENETDEIHKIEIL